MESQKLPAVTKTFSLDSMKHSFLHPMELINSWSFSFINNNNKMFDYKKQPHENVVTPNCGRIDLGCFSKPQEMRPKTLADSDTIAKIVHESPKTKKHSKKKRHKKRKHSKSNNKNEALQKMDLDDKDQSVAAVAASSTVMDADTVDCCYSPKKINFRCRLPSECESEDSFIVFEDNPDGNCQETFYPNSLCIELESDSDDTESSYRYQSDLASDASLTKKVRFANTEHLCEVHPMIQWSYAYRKARKGPWEQHALDRMRFQNRINNTKSVLDYVLQPAHRNRIYRDRFKEPTELRCSF